MSTLEINNELVEYARGLVLKKTGLELLSSETKFFLRIRGLMVKQLIEERINPDDKELIDRVAMVHSRLIIPPKFNKTEFGQILFTLLKL